MSRRCDIHVDHLALLVHRPVDIAPHSGDLDIGLLDEPPIPRQMPGRRGRVDQQGVNRCTHRYRVTWSTSMPRSARSSSRSPVGQPVAQVPAHRQQDHLGREAESSEARRHPHRRSRTASALHRATFTTTVRSVNATEPLDDASGPRRVVVLTLLSSARTSMRPYDHLGQVGRLTANFVTASPDIV
jgi:hypothetical protein